MSTETETEPTKAEILVSEIEHLLTCAAGEHAIMQAVGYTGKKQALKRQLARIGKHDLIRRIFEWDALYRESSSR